MNNKEFEHKTLSSQFGLFSLFLTGFIFLLLSFCIPLLSLAQTAPSIPSVSGINNVDINQIFPNGLPAPISDFVQKLKDMFSGGASKIGTTLPNINISDMSFSNAQNIWGKINNWFSNNIGVSFRDIIRTVVNLIIWIWELIIKLIRVGLSYL